MNTQKPKLTKSNLLIKIATVLLLLFPLVSLASIVTIHTSLGSFDVDLYDNAAPLTVANFMNYVNSGAYDNSFIHRSVPGFVIQGGGYTWDSTLNTVSAIPSNTPIANEFSNTNPNVRGAISMATISGYPNGATTQWFINLADNSSSLDTQNGGFTVFGMVMGDGMQVVDAIAALSVFNLGDPFRSVPMIDYTGGAVTSSNLVLVTNISAVPAPAAFWLFGSGLLGLIGVAHRKPA